MSRAATKPSAPTAEQLAKLPSLPSAKHREAWEKVCQQASPGKARDGAYWKLCGYSLRRSAAIAGCDNKTVHEFLVRWGLLELTQGTDALMRHHRTVEQLATERLIERGVDGFEDTSDRDLSVIAGISADKRQRYEERLQGVPDGQSALEKLVDGLRKGEIEAKIEIHTPGGQATIEVSDGRRETSTEVYDVGSDDDA